MKSLTLILSTACALALPVTAVSAASAVPFIHDQTSAPEHGGGCRKSSPPGQCCHAGSQPLHCH